MSLHRVCCCAADCGSCPCSSHTYKVTWTGKFEVKNDECSCRDWLGRRQGVRVEGYTIQDGTQRNLTTVVSACADGIGPYGAGTAAFVTYYDASCTQGSCPGFGCNLNYSCYYVLTKPTDPLCKWSLAVGMYDLGRVKSTATAPFYENTQVVMLYEAAYAGNCTAPGVLTYVGTQYWDGTSAAVDDCLDYNNAGLVYQGKIAGITPGTVTIA